MPTKCPKCSANVNKNHKSIKCLFCELSYHQNCSTLSEELFSAISGAGTQIWTCEICRAQMRTMQQEHSRMLAENQSLKTINDNLQTRVNSLQSQIQNMKTEIKNEVLQELSRDGMANQNLNNTPRILRTEILSACAKKEKGKNVD